jgi:CspA family cold shock protein
MRTGFVKSYVADRGFGFIAPDDSERDVFVHISNVEGGALTPDDEVEFEVGEDKRSGRPCAVNVRVVRKAEAA